MIRPARPCRAYTADSIRTPSPIPPQPRAIKSTLPAAPTAHQHSRTPEGGTMDTVREVVVLSGARTAIGDYGGGLKDVPPSELAATAVREAVKRAKIDAKQV